MAPATVARKAAALRMWAQFLCREGACAQDWTAALDTGKLQNRRLPITLSASEIDRLLDAPPADTPQGLRDRAMLELMYGSGLRVCRNWSTSKCRNWTFARAWSVPSERGTRSDDIPLGDELRTAIASYLATGRPAFLRGKPPSPPFS